MIKTISNNYYRQFTLPYPPSINKYYAVVNGRKILSSNGRAYKDAVYTNVLCHGLRQPLTGRLGIIGKIYPPDKRQRDLNNLYKSLLDALQYACVYKDDSQIDDEHFMRAEIVPNGKVEIIIYDLDKMEADKMMWNKKLEQAGLIKADTNLLPDYNINIHWTESPNFYNSLTAIKLNENYQNKNIIAHTSNHVDWNVTLSADDFFNLVKEAGHTKTVFCPDCKSSEVKIRSAYHKGGFRYECLNNLCERITFIYP